MVRPVQRQLVLLEESRAVGQAAHMAGADGHDRDAGHHGLDEVEDVGGRLRARR